MACILLLQEIKYFLCGKVQVNIKHGLVMVSIVN